MRRILLSIVLMLLSGLMLNHASTAFAQVCDPTPTATPTPQDYQAKVQGISSGLVAYYPLDETSGTTAFDRSGNGRNGNYQNGVTLNASTFPNGDPVPSFDGTDDNVNFYSSGLSSAFPATSGTLMVWMRVSAGGVWTDGVQRRVVNMQVNTSNRVFIAKSASNNQIRGVRNPGTAANTTTSSTGWIQVVMTWNESGTTVSLYTNGTFRESQTISSWSGSISSATIGGITGEFFSGNIAHVALWNVVLSGAQIADLATTSDAVPTATNTPACSTATNTFTNTPTNTHTETPTDTPTDTPTNTGAAPTNTPTPTNTGDTPTPTPTDTGVSPTPTPTPTGTLPIVIVITVVLTTHTPTNTPDWTATPTPSSTFDDVVYFPPGEGGQYGGQLIFRIDAGQILIVMLLVLIFSNRIIRFIRGLRGKEG